MAEFFVFDWTYKHWMDALTPAQVAERVAQNPAFQDKYNARFQSGDIKEIYPDGHLPAGETISPDTKEVCIKIPSISYEDVRHYKDEHLDNTNPESPIILLRRRYKVNWSQVSQTIKNQLASNRIVTLNNVSLMKLVDKVT